MKLTIGMATYDDYDGVYFTIQAIRTYHPEVLSNIELLVVDNHPNTKTSEYIQCLLDKQRMGGGIWKGTYVPMEEPQGTTQPRNRIFKEASGDAVLVIDSHVLLYPDTLAKLFEYYQDGFEHHGLYSGPLMYDNGQLCGSHFDDVWRDQMWGIWGRAWSCPCGELHFTVINTTEGVCSFRDLAMWLPTSPRECPVCHKIFPDQLPYRQHETALVFHGYNQLHEGNAPFEIPGMGLGLFTCRKDAWLGFNEHFRGFGGEEMYIHEKYRRHGRRCLCLPWLKWGHRFGRANGLPYAPIATIFNRVRNYILGHQELELNLDRCFNHFCKIHKFGPAQFHYIAGDPINHTEPYFPPGYIHPPLSAQSENSSTMQRMLSETKS